MRTVIGAVGRVLVTVGLLILLFVAYQLWGTGIYEARAQSDLKSQFNRDLARHGSQSQTTTSGATPTTAPTSTTAPSALSPAPAEGDPVGVIKIDKIGVDKVVVEGTSVPDLRKVGLLIGVGAAAVVAGWLWNFQFPVVKKIWTSSYVLVAGG